MLFYKHYVGEDNLLYTHCDIGNYADDNHIYYANSCTITLKNVLENDTRAAITWFENNYMDANPDKFQSIILNRGGDVSISLTVQDKLLFRVITLEC